MTENAPAPSKSSTSRIWYSGGGIVTLLALANFWQPSNGGVVQRSHEPIDVAEKIDTNQSHGPRVTVIRPKLSTTPRTTTLPCFATWHDVAELHARASGYLAQLPVDIGHRVSTGDILAMLEAPELDRDVALGEVTVKHREAAIKQNEARLKSAIAEKRAVDVSYEKAKADVARWQAEQTFRAKEFARLDELRASETIQPALVDEKKYHLQAVEAALRSAETVIQSAQENIVASAARVELAEADLKVARVQANFAQAELDKKQLMASFRKITSPFDGVITARNYYRGEFVRAADHGGSKPILVVGRTDLIRVVVFVPDRDVPFTQEGDHVVIEFDSLPGKKFSGRISRVALLQDSTTRTMRAEVDLDNRENLIVDQMYGRMVIELEVSGNCLFIPSTCLVGKLERNHGAVFVVQNHVARLRSIQVGRHDGIVVEVLEGLGPNEVVISLPPGGLTDGMAVRENSMSTQQFAVSEKTVSY